MRLFRIVIVNIPVFIQLNNLGRSTRQ